MSAADRLGKRYMSLLMRWSHSTGQYRQQLSLALNALGGRIEREHRA